MGSTSGSCRAPKRMNCKSSLARLSRVSSSDHGISIGPDSWLSEPSSVSTFDPHSLHPHILTQPPSLVFENQDINIQEQLELARHFGPLHRHATTGHPEGLDEVHGTLSLFFLQSRLARCSLFSTIACLSSRLHGWSRSPRYVRLHQGRSLSQ